ncbi:MAG: hypothetical protein DRN04_03355 [Thermoprotei archaeon]|nr:MAG: hypothetical protein DRN04_03355 [Thermoprotei archaeon]
MFTEIPEDIRAILEKDEKILWIGRPRGAPFILKGLVVVPLMVFFGALPILVVPLYEVITEPPVLLFLAFWEFFPTLTIFGVTVYPVLLLRNILYVITDKHVIVRKGVIGIDFDILNLELVQQVNIDVGIWDKIYSTGTLVVQAIGVSPIKFYSIPEPLKVHSILTRAVKEAISAKL